MFKIKSLLLLTLVTLSSFAVTIKLGSVAPKNTPWDDAIRKIGLQWHQVTKGKIEMKIYAGGIVGDELSMLEKMKSGTLSAAAVSGLGLSAIYPDILSTQLPMLYESQEEFEYVLEQMKPYYEEELEKIGFKVLTWTKVGWAHFFCKNPIVTPEDMMKEKMFVYAENPESEKLWRNMGFNPVPLSTNDMMTALQSNGVTTFANTPLATLAFQWFGLANYMSDLKWAPLIGGIVISTDVWNTFPPKLQMVLAAIAEKNGEIMQAEIDSKDLEALESMKEYGLNVVNVPKESYPAWQKVAEKAYEQMLGSTISQKSFDMVQSHIKAYRAKNR